MLLDFDEESMLFPSILLSNGFESARIIPDTIVNSRRVIYGITTCDRTAVKSLIFDCSFLKFLNIPCQ